MTEYLEQFDQYLDQQLTADQLAAFENKLATDEAFRKKFEEHRQGRTDIEAYFLGKEMATWETTSPKGQKMHWIPKTMVLVLLIALFALLVFLIFRKRQVEEAPDRPAQIYAQYYRPDPGLPTLMNENESDPFMDGMVLYKIGEYDSALEKWSTLHGSSDTLHYYLSQIALAQDEWSLAQRYLDSISSRSTFYQEAQWYRLLLVLRENQLDSAQLLLDNLELMNYKVNAVKNIREIIAQ